MFKTCSSKFRKQTEDGKEHIGVQIDSIGMQVHGMNPTQSAQGTLCSLTQCTHKHKLCLLFSPRSWLINPLYG